MEDNFIYQGETLSISFQFGDLNGEEIYIGLYRDNTQILLKSSSDLIEDTENEDTYILLLEPTFTKQMRAGLYDIEILLKNNDGNLVCINKGIIKFNVKSDNICSVI